MGFDNVPSGSTPRSRSIGSTVQDSDKTSASVGSAAITDGNMPLDSVNDLFSIVDDDVPLGSLPQTGGDRQLGGMVGLLLLSAYCAVRLYKSRSVEQ